MMYLKVGSFYKNQKGDVIKIVRDNGQGGSPFVGHTGCEYGHMGSVILNYDESECLVEEVTFNIKTELPSEGLIINSPAVKKIAKKIACPPGSYRRASSPVVVVPPTTATIGEMITATSTAATAPTSTPASEIRRPHKHAAAIKAWAEGKMVEYKGPHCAEWRPLLPPGESTVTWKEEVEYRVREAPIERFIGIRSRRGGGIELTDDQSSVTAVKYLGRRRGLEPIMGILKIGIDPTTYKFVSAEQVDV
jgi:hypothetical protein